MAVLVLNIYQTILKSLLICLVVMIGGCAGSSGGQRLEQVLAPDPQLAESPANQGQPSSPGQVVRLPENFPTEIPVYPRSVLTKVTQATKPPAMPALPSPTNLPEVGSEAGVVTRWQTQDEIDRVKTFYQQQFQDNGWRLLSSAPETETIMARRGNLIVTVTLPTLSQPATPSTSGNQDNDRPPVKTEFLLQYDRFSNQLAGQPSPASSQGSPSNPSEDPTEDQFIGPLLPPAQDSGTSTPTANPSPAPFSGSQTFNDLDKVPESLRSSVADLSSLGVLPLNPPGRKSTAPSNLLEPGKVITRREYARWLVVANNRFFVDRPAWQVRLGDVSTKAIFQDVPTSDPDFAAIQGLAEAGIIPSPLSNETVQTFRPDAPLIREQMLLWKVPLDVRRVLPPANLEAVKQAWGFQDATRIDPKTLQAVQADFQNGDLSNIRRVFGYTTLFQPKKAVTRAEAAATLWYFGSQAEGISAQELVKLTPPNLPE